MRFIAAADLHCHNYTQFAKIVNGLNSRLLDCLSVLDEIKEYMVNNDIKAFLFLGDLFNSRTKISIEIYHLVYEAIKQINQIGAEIHLLVGNHDQFLKKGVYHSVRPFSDIAHVIDCPEKFYLGDERLPVYAIPYIESLKARTEAIKSLIGEKQERQGILIAHTGVAGAKVSSLSEYVLKDEVEMKDLHPELFDAVLLGHYHKGQYLADNVLYVGSPLQLNFGERGDKKGFWDIKIDGSGFEANMVESHAPKFVLIDGSEDEGELEIRGNYVKVVLPESDDLEVKEIKNALLELGAKA